MDTLRSVAQAKPRDQEESFGSKLNNAFEAAKHHSSVLAQHVVGQVQQLVGGKRRRTRKNPRHRKGNRSRLGKRRGRKSRKHSRN